MVTLHQVWYLSAKEYKNRIYLNFGSYPKGNAIMNVITGTMLMKAQEKVAEVYWIPRRTKY